MKHATQLKQNEAGKGSLLVPAKAIAKELSCSTRYVHLLHEQGHIPGHRIGKGCIRFNPQAVFAALGIKEEVQP